MGEKERTLPGTLIENKIYDKVVSIQTSKTGAFKGKEKLLSQIKKATTTSSTDM